MGYFFSHPPLSDILILSSLHFYDPVLGVYPRSYACCLPLIPSSALHVIFIYLFLAIRCGLAASDLINLGVWTTVQLTATRWRLHGHATGNASAFLSLRPPNLNLDPHSSTGVLTLMLTRVHALKHTHPPTHTNTHTFLDKLKRWLSFAPHCSCCNYDYECDPANGPPLPEYMLFFLLLSNLCRLP